MGNKKKKRSEQPLLNDDAAHDRSVTAVPGVASDQRASHPDADSTTVPNANQKRKDKRKENAVTLPISADGYIEDSVAAVAGLSLKKHRRQQSAADDHAATDGSAADQHGVVKSAKKRKHHDKSAGDRSVEVRGADVEPENDRDSAAAPAKRKSGKCRSETTSAQHFSAIGDRPGASPVSKKNGFDKAASQQDSPAVSSTKSSKNQKAMPAENRKNGSVSYTRPPKNTREPIEQQAVTAVTTAKNSRESPAVDEDESSADAEQKPSKKAKKHKKKNQTKKDSKPEGHAAAETDTPKVSARNAALAYLDAWKSDKNNWSFQKVRQVWLLQHMYSVADVDDDRFAILLEYLEPLKGNARAETVRKAEEMLAKADDDDGAAGPDGGSAAPAVNDLALLRAKEIVQLLSTD